MIFSVVVSAAFNAHATTVTYSLDDVILADGEQLAGTFEWTYTVGDFEGGSGEFTALEIPWTPHSLGDSDLNTEIQTTSIEITGVGSYHDAGLDISLKFDAITPTQPSSLDLALSFYECCGNGFKDQPFLSGSISPIILAGDGNADGVVDGLDYLLWANFFGDNPAADPPGPPANGDYDNNGVVDGSDYLVWAGNFGSQTASSVPEPAGGILLIVSTAFVGCVRHPRRNRKTPS
jgi:hypothetical protein